MNSTSSRIHRGIYGKSDNVNAKENANEDFQNGYKVGLAIKDTDTAFTTEYVRLGQPNDGPALAKFREWKRGLWAAVMQKLLIS